MALQNSQPRGAPLEELIETHGKRLYGLCVRLCGNTTDADDLYQETWLRVYCRFGQYDDSRPFEHWLTAVCVNCFRDMRRRDRFASLLVRFATDEEQEAAINAAPDPSAGDEEKADLWEAVRALPPACATVVTLHYYSGWDVREIAKSLRIPEGTVKYRLHRARELLRQELEN